MKLDLVSNNIIAIALYLDNKIPGSISEIWIDSKQINSIKKSLPNESEISEYIIDTKKLIDSVKDSRRRKYLREILHSLTYQIAQTEKKTGQFSYSDFSINSFGYEIERVSEEEIQVIQENISNIEKKVGKSRQEIYAKYIVPKNEYLSVFKECVLLAEQSLPFYITSFPDNGFEYELTSGEPWTAFNYHTAPYKSKLILNTDTTFTKLDLQRLAYHEAYGGHHSELSHKDILLTNQGRGEHGLIITFSPQTFMSEAIAESIFVLFGGLDESDDEQVLSWQYDRLIFTLYNLATHLYFEDGLNKKEIRLMLKKYSISTESLDGILGFSLDPVYGKYSPVYYSATNFILENYKRSQNQEQLVNDLFTKPCTPGIILQPI